jgi:hypothetical protein
MATKKTKTKTLEIPVVQPEPIELLPTRTKKIGRPTIFTKQMALYICTRIAEGESLREIVKTEGVPDRTTVYDWLLRNEEFAHQYTRAREEQADTLADEIIAIADEQPEIIAVVDKKTGALIEHKLDGAFLQWQKNRIDARKWTAMKLKPKKYGDKLQVAGSKDEPLEHKVEVTSLFDGLLQNLELSKQVKVSE